ncbi:SDR family NAD(P)-dependent oxidoreductase [[Kitasatospora] papulosa]|uniref:SDR family NAD(P)-dependent oxidoreductase n=1 Tax=[Kitasatospora] papulosa TaxID=1464011 RepID=UPI002E28C120|nr:SDR family NAD(P)-dependent oxidoreductase [[Kitasatospora] papulosa]
MPYTADLTGDQAVRSYAADVADTDGLRTAIKTAIDELGAPEVLVYNAALLQPASPTDGDDHGWLNAFAVNVLGAKVAAETVLPTVRGHASLLFTGGGLADQPSPEWASLSVGKAALRSYAQTLAAELEGTDVRATVVTINGGIGGGQERFEPAVLAKAYLDLHHEPAAAWTAELRRD